MSQKIQSLQKILNGLVDVDEPITITGISNNSQQVKPGDLFIAAVGETIDARQFIPAAVEQGAAAIVYENADGYVLKNSVPLPAFPIENLNRNQGLIAARFYDDPSKAMRCIGVTGTNGKTSCTQWIAQALSESRVLCGVMGTLGSGFPDELKQTGYTTPDPVRLQAELDLMRQQGALAAAIEVSSHALAQHRLNGMHFDVVAFTQLSRDHLDCHQDMDSYAAAKKLLFKWEGLKAAVINIDDPLGADWAAQFAHHYPVITYSLSNPDASVYADKMCATAQGFDVSVKTLWGEGEFALPFWGAFNVHNALLVFSVLMHFDIPMAQALQCLSSLKPVDGRMDMLGGNEQPAVIVDYAHTPDALKNALQALREHCEAALWCVFGCGGDRDRGKRAEMAAIAEQYSDHVVVTSDNPRTESPERIVSDMMAGFSRQGILIEIDRAKAIHDTIQKAGKNDLILIAGKGHENYQIIGETTLPFSDGEQVKAALMQRGIKK